MKNLLLIFALLLGSVGFAQPDLEVHNNTGCTIYVQSQHVSGACTNVPSSPNGWVAIPPGTIHNFTTAVPGAGDLHRVLISGDIPGTCPVVVLDNPGNPCWTGPTTAVGNLCTCGGTYNAAFAPGMPHIIDVS